MSPKRRIFVKRGIGRLRLCAFLAVGLLIAVAACAPESTQWAPSPTAKRNDVRWITFEHSVRFRADDSVGSGEAQRLAAFLSRHDAGYRDQILIGAVGNRDASFDVRAAARREAAVIALLRGGDLGARLLPQTPTKNAWDGSVTVVLGRFVVLPPDCPDWTKPVDGDPRNGPSSNFGCATATNLGLMVANPEDLVRGSTPGPADGAAGARRYKEYREGEQAPAPSITPLVIQSGVSGAGQ